MQNPPHRHCERSEAIQSRTRSPGLFASLAITKTVNFSPLKRVAVTHAATRTVMLPAELVPHPRLDLGHAAEPAVVVLGLLAHVAEHLGMRQDQEALLGKALQHVLRNLLRREV